MTHIDTILLVEDDDLSRDALERRLARSGFRVLPAVDGEEALQVVQSAAPDLILMDLGLPRLDGWSVTRLLKSQSATSRIPIIVVSAHVDIEDRKAVQALGGDGLHPKPVQFDGLLQTIGELLRGRRMAEGLLS
jgi:two-component system, cell cycle response regulator DivK